MRQKQIHPEFLDDLELWWPEDELKVYYYRESKGKKKQELQNGASAGQKAAAILAFLLNYGEMPLVVDQPEDDLDNSLITSLVVHGIVENKKKRQLIIVTHNPNIVVNGDAERVLVMQYENGQIELEKAGGLQDRDIRKLICDIMEGGADAFNKRYKRIINKIETYTGKENDDV